MRKDSSHSGPWGQILLRWASRNSEQEQWEYKAILWTLMFITEGNRTVRKNHNQHLLIPVQTACSLHRKVWLQFNIDTSVFTVSLYCTSSQAMVSHCGALVQSWVSSCENNNGEVKMKYFFSLQISFVFICYSKFHTTSYVSITVLEVCNSPEKAAYYHALGHQFHGFISDLELSTPYSLEEFNQMRRALVSSVYTIF